MGVSASASMNQVYQASLNNLFQEEDSSCNAECDSTISGIDITITGSTIGGEIDISASCSSIANCTMQNTLEATTFTQLNDVQTAVASAPQQKLWMWPGVSVAVTDNYTKQTMTNNIAQVITSTCNSSTSVGVSNININIANSSVSDGIKISADGDASVACQMSNSATISTSSSASATQSATSTAGGTGRKLTGLSIVFFFILMFGFAVFVFYYFRYKENLERIDRAAEGVSKGLELATLEREETTEIRKEEIAAEREKQQGLFKLAEQQIAAGQTPTVFESPASTVPGAGAGGSVSTVPGGSVSAAPTVPISAAPTVPVSGVPGAGGSVSGVPGAGGSVSGAPTVSGFPTSLSFIQPSNVSNTGSLTR